jgi:hypothetical protein
MIKRVRGGDAKVVAPRAEPMPSAVLLRKGWRSHLGELIGSARRDLVIAAPFITQGGVDIVRSRLTNELKTQGKINILICLDVISIGQGTCDPLAIKSLLDGVGSSALTYVPRLHAKVYISDDRAAIISSGNLTQGGLVTNFEYGVAFDEPTIVEQVRNDLSDYAMFGAALEEEQLTAFCETSQPLREAYQRQTASVDRAFREEFQRQARLAEDQLIRLRLAGGARHTVFAKTIVYLLKRHGPLKTRELHPLIQTIHPDLCDDSVDRIIDGENFGKKWRHAARTAQQRLKGAGLIDRAGDGRWHLTSGGIEP